tara:strand:+ start:1972 stop:2454 length:483 start_codon:yes stop_codon:yes gene_type:complete
MEETYTPSFHEICSKVNNAKDKAKKIGVLRKYRTECLEMFLNSGLNPNIVWMLPHGDVPYKPNEAPEGTEHTILAQEARNLYNYVKMNRSRLNLSEVIGNEHINMAQREMMFIQMLEGLHTKEAQLVILAKDKLLSKNFKGLTATCVCEAFGWSDTFEPR